ncbi:MAG: nucleotidyltransferase domain-containing protein [Nanoarchaeota archaeon]|nr:nucleotidyltransferase domain-containing protein [Nanoarchaeota archaeon]
MLKIINNLKPFFDDCYRRINIREYSRLMKITPPTASKLLFELNKEGLLEIEKDRNYIFYYANKNNKTFIDLSGIYWRLKLDKLIDFLNKNLTSPIIILFGSLSKAETKEDSDIDLCIIGHKKELDLKIFENNLKRKIQLFFYSSVEDIKNKELTNNIINGYILEGRLRF